MSSQKIKREETCVEEMLSGGQIEPSESPWSAPVVLVTKKDGGTRFCVDYRKLNLATVKDAYPLPRRDDTLDMLAGKRWFSTLDLASGYWQVPLSPEARCKTIPPPQPVMQKRSQLTNMEIALQNLFPVGSVTEKDVSSSEPLPESLEGCFSCVFLLTNVRY